MDKLSFLIQMLHHGRVEAEQAKVKEDLAMDKLSKLPEYLAYQAALKDRKNSEAMVKAQTEDVRSTAIQAWSDTGKTKFPGVSVINSKALDYEPGQAVNYCIEKKKSKFLSLETKDFEKWALGILVTDVDTARELGIDFIQVVDEPAARISSNLDDAMQEIINNTVEEITQPTPSGEKES